MFDPFHDFDTAGYLRNFDREKSLDIVKVVEHELFRANLLEAAAHLSGCQSIRYLDFLQVHRILFSGFYPWAGMDRADTAPNSAINKGSTKFAHPKDAQRAVNEGLRLGTDTRKMKKFPGEIMGLFAYGHPFLDGNGRTMLLVHLELCRRAGFSIDWQRSKKIDYLQALISEIESPGKGILDRYLLGFIATAQPNSNIGWMRSEAMVQSDHNADMSDEISGDFQQASVMAAYQQFEHQRGYEIK